VTEQKVERYQGGSYEVVPHLLDKSADPRSQLLAISRSMQTLTAPNPAEDPFPVVFVEYFIASQDVYGLGWSCTTQGADQIADTTQPRVWRVMSVTQLRSYRNASVLRNAYSTDQALGEQLLGPVLGDRLEASAQGSFGLAVAPEGMLWLTRWEQIRLAPREITGLATRGTRVPDRITSLRDILQPATVAAREVRYPRAGVWCVPTLAGHWTNSPRRFKLNLGPLAAGVAAGSAIARQAAGFWVGEVRDPTLQRDIHWVNFVRGMRRQDMGYLFWDRGWAGDTWNPQPVTSICVIQAEQ